MMFKSTLKLTLAFITDHIMAFVLAWVLSFALAALKLNQYRAAILVLTIFTSFMHAVLLYPSASKEGGRDRNRTEYNHMKRFLPKGAVAMIISMLPVIFFYMASVIDISGLIKPEDSLSIFKILFFQYTGFTLFLSDRLAGLVMIIPLAVATLGYLAGYYEINIIDRLVYINNKKSK